MGCATMLISRVQSMESALEATCSDGSRRWAFSSQASSPCKPMGSVTAGKSKAERQRSAHHIRALTNLLAFVCAVVLQLWLRGVGVSQAGQSDFVPLLADQLSFLTPLSPASLSQAETASSASIQLVAASRADPKAPLMFNQLMAPINPMVIDMLSVEQTKCRVMQDWKQHHASITATVAATSTAVAAGSPPFSWIRVPRLAMVRAHAHTGCAHSSKHRLDRPPCMSDLLFRCGPVA